MSTSMKTLLETIEYLPDAEQALIEELLKRIILAWDPNFTKATPAERASIEEGKRQIACGETVSLEELMGELNL